MRLSIEVTPEQHQLLKAVSASRGQTIKDYVLERVFQSLPETKVKELDPLDAFLQPRIEAAEQGKVINRSVLDIFKQVHQ